jgi:hypothetical protein
MSACLRDSKWLWRKWAAPGVIFGRYQAVSFYLRYPLL